MSWIHIQVIVVNCERLGAFSDRRHKLLHLKHHPAPVCDFCLTKRKVRGRDTICTHKRATNQWEAAGRQLESIQILKMCIWCRETFRKAYEILTSEIWCDVIDCNIQITQNHRQLGHLFWPERRERAQRRENKQVWAPDWDGERLFCF